MDLEAIVINEKNNALYADHKEEIVKSSGNDGNPIYNPYSSDELVDWKWPSKAYIEGYKKSLKEENWKRSWGVFADSRVIGSLDLFGGQVKGNLHRCNLMMGVSSDQKGKGLGKFLLNFSKNWASENGICWIDLGVFSTNYPALGLYKKYGFIETGMTRDAYRVSGSSINLINMSYEVPDVDRA